jgi:DNA-binding beta-propeller fold protein YncE
LKVVGRYKLAASQPTGLVFDAKARRLYVAVRYAVVALDADTGNETGRVATPAGTDMLWLDAPTSTLYVASAGSVAIIRTGAGKLDKLGELNTDVRAHVLAFDPATNLVYVPGGREGRSKLLILKRVPSAFAQPAEQMAQQQGATTSTPRR